MFFVGDISNLYSWGESKPIESNTMVGDTSIVNGVYKPIYNVWGAPPNVGLIRSFFVLLRPWSSLEVGSSSGWIRVVRRMLEVPQPMYGSWTGPGKSFWETMRS